MGSNVKKGKGDMLDLKKDQVVTAVVIADSFDSRFRPITEATPRCLLPVANKPILGYTLEFLSKSGVQEVIVYCSSHPSQVKQYLEKAHWTGESRPGFSDMNVVVISNEECRSFGDAMRDLDGKGLIRGDFILVSGDTISNIDLRPLLDQHKERCKEDKNCSMTMVFRRALPGHHCRTVDEEVLLATNGEKGRVLHHMRPSPDDKRVSFPLEIFQENSTVEICHDLLDPGISICSQSIPPLFADNFDFQTFDSFVQGIIGDDLIDSTLYASVLTEGYVARANCLRSYISLSRDVLRRWLYPFVPEESNGSEEEKGQDCRLHRHNVYKCKGVQLSAGCQLERDVLLGPSCCVGKDAVLSSCSLGRSCQVGDESVVQNSIVMCGAQIGPGCQVRGSVLGSNVVLGKNVVVAPRCVVGNDVKLPDGTKLPEDTRLVSQPRSDGFSDDEEEKESGKKSGEFGSSAFRYVDSDDDSEAEDEDDVSGAGERDWPRAWGETLEERRKRLAAAKGGEDDEEDENSSSSEESDMEDMDEAPLGDLMEEEDAKKSVFHNEVLDSLQRGVQQSLSADNLTVEINSSRHAYNESWSSVVNSVTKSLLHIVVNKEEGLKGPKLLKEMKTVFGQFSDLLQSYCKTQSTEQDCLYALEDFAYDNESFAAIAKNAIHILYDIDVISEESILHWFKVKPEADEEEGLVKDKFAAKIRTSVKPLIEWLQEESSSGEEEESD